MPLTPPDTADAMSPLPTAPCGLHQGRGARFDRRPRCVPACVPNRFWRTQLSKGQSDGAPPKSGTAVRRRGLASLVFGVARPADAQASTLEGNALRLTLRFGSRDIAIGAIDSVEVQRRLRWCSVRIHTTVRIRDSWEGLVPRRGLEPPRGYPH